MLTLTIHMVRPGRDSTKGPVGTHYSYGEGEEQLSFGAPQINTPKAAIMRKHDSTTAINLKN